MSLNKQNSHGSKKKTRISQKRNETNWNFERREKLESETARSHRRHHQKQAKMTAGKCVGQDEGADYAIVGGAGDKARNESLFFFLAG